MKNKSKILTEGKEQCKFCGSVEMVYHQYIIKDSMCQECGEWQEGEYNYKNSAPQLK